MRNQLEDEDRNPSLAETYMYVRRGGHPERPILSTFSLGPSGIVESTEITYDYSFSLSQSALILVGSIFRLSAET
jgi:hypothetical protein